MKKDKKIKKIKIKKVVVHEPKPEPRSDWERHLDEECEYDCSFCYDEEE